MQTKIGLIARAALTVLLLCGRSEAQCVSSYYSANSATSIGVWLGNGWSGTGWPHASDASTAIDEGIAQWESGCAAQYSRDFPLLVANDFGDINVTVDFATRPTGSGVGCGEFDHELYPGTTRISGGTIILYGSDSNGFPCASADWDSVIAHELGHVLGLGNTRCAGRIMNQNFDPVHPEECEWVDYLWRVPGEPSDGGVIEPSWDCPLVLDLNGDGIHTTGLDRPVRFFDRDGDGSGDPTGWLDEYSEDAFLWLDLDSDGRVAARELFGSHMYVPTGVVARNGFQALALYDSDILGGNEDGRISPDDEIWDSLRLWSDRNHDGVSQGNEITSLGHHRIVALNLERRHEHSAFPDGNSTMLVGSYSRRVVRPGATNGTEVLRMDDIMFVRGN